MANNCSLIKRRVVADLSPILGEDAATGFSILNNGNSIELAPNGLPNHTYNYLMDKYNGDTVIATRETAKRYVDSKKSYLWTITGQLDYIDINKPGLYIILRNRPFIRNGELYINLRTLENSKYLQSGSLLLTDEIRENPNSYVIELSPEINISSLKTDGHNYIIPKDLYKHCLLSISNINPEKATESSKFILSKLQKIPGVKVAPMYSPDQFSSSEFLDLFNLVDADYGNRIYVQENIVGYTRNGTIFLNDLSIYDAETQIHEYSHIWAAAFKYNNPKEWENIKSILKSSKLWDAVLLDWNYALRPDPSEDMIASEVLARFSGEHNAQLLSLEENYNGILGALLRFWKWVSETVFDIHFTSVNEIAERVLYDLCNNTDLNLPISQKIDDILINSEFVILPSIDSSISITQTSPSNYIIDIPQSITSKQFFDLKLTDSNFREGLNRLIKKGYPLEYLYKFLRDKERLYRFIGNYSIELKNTKNKIIGKSDFSSELEIYNYENALHLALRKTLLDDWIALGNEYHEQKSEKTQSIQRLINFIEYCDKDNDGVQVIEEALSGDLESKTYLRQLSEQATLFALELIDLGYTLSESDLGESFNFENFYKGYDPTLPVLYLIKKRIVLDLYTQRPERFKQYIRDAYKYTNSNFLKSIIDKTNDLSEPIDVYIQNTGDAIYDSLLIKNSELIQRKLSESFKKIKKKDFHGAEIVVPKLYKGFKLSFTNKNGLTVTKNISEIDFRFWQTSRSFYKISPDFILDDKVKVDFVVRTLRGKYNILITDKFSNPILDDYGEVIPDSKILKDSDGYRIDSRTKKRLYKLPSEDNLYQIRKNSRGLETIIFKNRSDISLVITSFLQTDDFIVSILPFAYLNDGKLQVKNFNQLLRNCKALNTLPVFNDMYQLLLNNFEIQGNQLFQLYKSWEDKYNEYLLKAILSAFLQSILGIATRIPTQNMSSVQKQSFAAFTGDTMNNVFTTKWLQWLLGSDYDIDKAFITEYGIDDYGRFIKWSPILKDYNFEIFKKGLDLPFPNGKRIIDPLLVFSVEEPYIPITYTDIETYLSRLVEDFILLEKGIDSIIGNYFVPNNLSGDEISDYIEISIISELLSNINEFDNFFVPNLYKNNPRLLELITLLNTHNLHKVSASGALNFTTHIIDNIVSSSKMFVPSNKSIDSASTEFEDELKGIKSRLGNNDDGHSIAKGTENGATGKDGVGIAANGEKVYVNALHVTTAENHNFTPTTTLELIENPSFNIKRLRLRFKDSNGNIDVFDKVVGPVADAYMSKPIEIGYTRLAESCFGIPFYHYTKDAMQRMGALMTLAADNAKKLALAKFHADTNYFSMHIYLTLMGVPPYVIINYFNSDAFMNVYNRMKNNITDPNYKSNMNAFKDTLREIINETSNLISNLTESEESTELLLEKLEDYEQLLEISNCADEITTYARILKVNQGIDITDLMSIRDQFIKLYESYQTYGEWFPEEDGEKDSSEKLLSLNKYGKFSDRVNISSILIVKNKKANVALKKAGINLLTPFNFDLFISDSQYRDAIIAVADAQKHTFNIFFNVSKSPHFMEMLSVYNDVLKVLSEATSLGSLLYDQSKYLYLDDHISNRSGQGEDSRIEFTIPSLKVILANIIDAFKDYMLSKFILENKNDLSIKYNTLNIEFNNNSDLYRFIGFVNNYIIPKLMSLYPDNLFLKDLEIDYLFYKANDNFILYKSSDNLNKLKNSVWNGATLLASKQNAFNEFSTKPVSEILSEFVGPIKTATLGDIFWLYNSLVLMISPGKSLEDLFSDMNNNTVSFKYKYNLLILLYDLKLRDIKFDPKVFTSIIFKLYGKKFGGQLRFYNRKNSASLIDLAPIITHFNDRLLTENDEVKFPRILFNMPVNIDTLNYVDITDKLINGIKSGIITVNFLENC